MNDYNFDVSFRIKHPTMDPDLICSTLCMKAKRKWKAGERRKTTKGRLLEGLYDESYCSFKLEAGIDEKLIDSIKDMNRKLKSHQGFLEGIRNTGGVLEYFIGLYFEVNTGETFSCALLSELSDMGIDLSLDLYANQ